MWCLRGTSRGVNWPSIVGANLADRPGGISSARRTSPRACDTRVTLLITQTFLIFSDSSKAHLVISFASWKVAGSRRGSSAHLAMGREARSLGVGGPGGAAQLPHTRPAVVPGRV